MKYTDIDVAEEYQGDWIKFGVFDTVSKVDEPTIRAYSMANYPEEKGIMSSISVWLHRLPERTSQQARCLLTSFH